MAIPNRPPPATTRHPSGFKWSHILTWFGPNFKGRVLGPSSTDSNCHGDICPGYICPYQENFSCYWPDFDQTLKVGSWEHLELIPTDQVTLVLATFAHILAGPKFIFIGLKFFWTKIFLEPTFFWPTIFLDLKFFWAQNFVGLKFFLDPKSFWTKFFFLTQNFFWLKIFFDPKNFFGP